jgi:hypothetical protein
VKITGANFDSSAEDMTKRREEQMLPLLLPARDPKGAEGGDEVSGLVSSGRVTWEGVALAGPSGLANQETTPYVVHASSESSSSESSDDNSEDFLDLLVDTLAGDFDPELFI